jgi:hypothetical protein
MTDLTPEEQQVLRRLAALSEPALETKLTGIPTGRRGEIIQALVRRGGLIEVVAPHGRAKKPRYGLTDHGRELAALLPPEPAKRSPHAPSSPRPTVTLLAASLEGIRAQLTSLEARMGRLEAERPFTGTASPLETRKPRLDYHDFRRLARDAFAQIDRAGRTFGLVPIPDLRRALGDQVTRRDFDEYLLRLSQEGSLDLMPHHDPASLPEESRRDAIPHPTAGLLYFLRWSTP